MTQAGPGNHSSLFLAQVFFQELACHRSQIETSGDFFFFFFLESQEKGTLFTGIDCRDNGSLEQPEAIFITLQDGNLPERCQHGGTQCPEMRKRD